MDGDQRMGDGMWCSQGVLVGLVAVMLCFAGPLRASRWSQLQLAVFCSAPAMNAALGVLIGLAPGAERSSDVNTGMSPCPGAFLPVRILVWPQH